MKKLIIAAAAVLVCAAFCIPVFLTSGPDSTAAPAASVSASHTATIAPVNDIPASARTTTSSASRAGKDGSTKSDTAKRITQKDAEAFCQSLMTNQAGTIAAVKAIKNKNMRVAVTAKTTHIYAEPSRTSQVVATVRFGKKFRAHGTAKGWYQTKHGYVMSSKSVLYNAKKKHLALTFDDGPSTATTPTALKALKKNGCRATFFVLGQSVNGSTKKLIRQEAKLGCEIGNHSFDHALLTGLKAKAVKKQLAETDKRVKAITGKRPSLVRAPFGATNASVLRTMGRPNIYWSVDTQDWLFRNTSHLVSHVNEHARNGAVILMHDIHPSTAAGVDTVCRNLKKRGYEMVTVTELAAIRGKALHAGRTYYAL